MSDDAIWLIQTIYSNIADNNVDHVIYYLDKLPLQQLDSQTANDILFNTLNYCYKYNRPNMIKPIFKLWNVVYPEQIVLQEDDPDSLEYGNAPSLFASLFYTLPFASNIGLNTLIIAARGMSDYAPLRLFYEFTKYLDNVIIEKAADLVFKVYGDVPLYVIQEALTKADETNSSYLYNYLADKLNKISDYAEIPTYMADFRPATAQNGLWLISDDLEWPKAENRSLALETEFVIPNDCKVNIEQTLHNLPESELLNMMTAGLTGYFAEETIKEKRQEIMAFLRISTTKQKIEVFGNVIKQEALNSLQDDIRLFRLLGPSNPFIDTDADYRVDRMFECLAFAADDDDEQIINDWFTGSCLMCHRRIRRRFHAVRRPLAGGGWIECFCTWECVRNRVSQLEALYLSDENALGSYAVSMSMILFIEQQMLEIGIQDRLSITENLEEEFSTLNLTDPAVAEQLQATQSNIQQFSQLLTAGPQALEAYTKTLQPPDILKP